MQLASNRILELDGLRGTAIILVILFHLVLAAPTGSGFLNHLMLFGWSGVDLFFVLSGFLIGGILIDHRDSENYFGAFYARRFFRIVPIYLFVIAGYALCWMLGGDIRNTLLGNAGPPMPWYTYLSFTNNFWLAKHNTMDVFLPVTWSLAVEEQFYLTLPLMVRFVRPKKLTAVVLGVVAIVLTLRVVAAGFGMVTQNQAYVLPWFRTDALMIGVACAILVRDERLVRFLKERTWVLYAALGIFGAVIVGTGGALPDKNASPSTSLMTFGLTVVALFYAALLLLAVVAPGTSLAAFFRGRALRYLGKLSYFIYLVHQTLLTVAVSTATDIFGDGNKVAVWIALFLAIGVIVMAAQLSWTFFESKMLRLGHRVTYERKSKKDFPAPIPVVLASSTEAADVEPTSSAA